jgi:hypothetical protein
MYHQLINQDYHVLNSYTCLTLEKKLYPNLRFRNTEREGEGGIRSPIAVVVGRGPPQLLMRRLWARASDGEPGVVAGQVVQSSLAPAAFETGNAKIQRPRARIEPSPMRIRPSPVRI